MSSLWGFPLLGSWVSCLLFPSVCLLFSAVSVVLLRGCGRVPLFLAWCLALVGSPPCLLLPPLPPRLVPCGALVQFHAGTSLWVSGCSCDGSVALPLCWECGCALSSFLHFVSWQQRLLSPVWGCYHPLHHVAGAVRMLSLTTLRYSSGR